MLLVQNVHEKLKKCSVVITEPQIPWEVLQIERRWFFLMVDVLMHNPIFLLVWQIQASSFLLFKS